MCRVNLDTRTIAFATVALAAICSLSSRIFMAIYFAHPTTFIDFRSLNLSDRQLAGDAAFDLVDDDDFVVVRLRLTECSEPVFAVPIPLVTVAAPDIADQRFLKFPSLPSLGRLRRTRIKGAVVLFKNNRSVSNRNQKGFR